MISDVFKMSFSYCCASVFNANFRCPINRLHSNAAPWSEICACTCKSMYHYQVSKKNRRIFLYHIMKLATKHSPFDAEKKITLRLSFYINDVIVDLFLYKLLRFRQITKQIS